MKGCDYVEDGVWRTVRGRRIFIKDGQSLTEAMRDSGKFENDKKDDDNIKNDDTFKSNSLSDGKAKEALKKISQKYKIDNENIEIVETNNIQQTSTTKLDIKKIDNSNAEISIKRQIGLRKDDERGAYHEYAHQMETYWNSQQPKDMNNWGAKTIYDEMMDNGNKLKISLDDYYDRQTTYNSISTGFLNDDKLSSKIQKNVYDRLEQKGYSYKEIKELQSKELGNGGYSLNGPREFFAEGIATLELEGSKTEFTKIFEEEFKKEWKF
jgi:hypothetical protein